MKIKGLLGIPGAEEDKNVGTVWITDDDGTTVAISEDYEEGFVVGIYRDGGWDRGLDADEYHTFKLESMAVNFVRDEVAA